MAHMMRTLSSAARAVGQYLQAASAAVLNRQLPTAHILLSPAVPLLKYVMPVGAVLALGRLSGTDAMFARMMADEDARLQNIARKQQEHQQPLPQVGAQGPAKCVAETKT